MWWVSPRATSFVTSFRPTTSFVTWRMQIWLVPGFQESTGQSSFQKFQPLVSGNKFFPKISFGKSCCTRFRGGMQKNWGLWSRCWTLEWLPLCNRRQCKPTWGGCVMLTKIPWEFSQDRNWRLIGKKKCSLDCTFLPNVAWTLQPGNLRHISKHHRTLSTVH